MIQITGSYRTLGYIAYMGYRTLGYRLQGVTGPWDIDYVVLQNPGI